MSVGGWLVGSLVGGLVGSLIGAIVGVLARGSLGDSVATSVGTLVPTFGTVDATTVGACVAKSVGAADAAICVGSTENRKGLDGAELDSGMCVGASSGWRIASTRDGLEPLAVPLSLAGTGTRPF